MVRSRYITDAAKGEPCTMNVAGICNYDPQTTVFAHFRFLGDCGTGIKPSDLQGGFACFECHRWLDSPTPNERGDDYDLDRAWYAARSMARTFKRLSELSIIKIKGYEP